MSEIAAKPDRRLLKLSSEDDAVAELERLRRGHRMAGNWTLEQIAWHLAGVMEMCFATPITPDARATPEQLERQNRFFGMLFRDKPMATGELTAPPPFMPPEKCEAAEVDRLIAAMRRLKTYAEPMIVMGPMGPASIENCRRAHLVHASHHLSHLIPTPA